MSVSPVTEQLLELNALRHTSPNPGIVVTRTPLRISFAGGGTDLPEFYDREFGAVFSTAINKYVYVTVKRHSPLFCEPIRLNYSESEKVQRIDEIRNDIARECVRFLNIDPPIYISTVADLPASTGLGGSSSFAVGLLNALHAFKGERVGAGQLAEEASHIEIEVLRQPIGKQDQYAAAFGGLNYFCFQPGGGVSVEPQRLVNGEVRELFSHLAVFWTGMRRDASSVLTEQKANISDRMTYLLKMRDQTEQLKGLVCNGRVDIEEFGRVLDEGWSLKRELASTISNEKIDGWYQRAKAAGAIGGKICGAGGGGFLMFVVHQENRQRVSEALSDLLEVAFDYEVQGSQLVLPFL